ncbi:MAG: hypothetical protein B6D63_03310 [Candidatus Latescibacteria bacterium 4484_7]|nr:MAG: hypothetical protein B6D63_03310 [Candidatus Latescibacteria bacterium 4484_7]
MKREILLTPGPVNIPNELWRYAASMHHRTDEFRAIVQDAIGSLQRLLATNAHVYLLTSSGTGAMEAAAANFVSDDELVLVVSSGKFGDRWGEILSAQGKHFELMRLPADERIDVDSVAAEIDSGKYGSAMLTHVESSTGTLFPLQELKSKVSNDEVLFIVDSIASIGVEELEMDSLGLDVVVGCSQKALASPAGVSFIAASGRALKKASGGKKRAYYFDLTRYTDEFKVGDTPFTPAVQTFCLMHHNLKALERIGWDNTRERHRAIASEFVRIAEGMGFEELSRNPSSAVQALRLPRRLEGKGFAAAVREGTGYVVADGQGALKGKIMRTGYLGLVGGEAVLDFVEKLARLMATLGYDTEPAIGNEARERFSFYKPLLSRLA